jgi:hypothetical protein
MHDNYKKGQEAILKMQERALQLGWDVCFPTVESRFDAVLVDTNGKCHRIQTKYVDYHRSFSKGSVVLDLRKKTWNHGQTKTYSKSEIDAIVAYIPQAKRLVWLGPEVFHQKASVTLRYQPSKNNQVRGTRKVPDYEW